MYIFISFPSSGDLRIDDSKSSLDLCSAVVLVRISDFFVISAALAFANSSLDIDLRVSKEADHLNIVPTCSIAVFTVFLQSVACEISQRKELTLEQFVKNHPGGSIGKVLDEEEIL